MSKRREREDSWQREWQFKVQSWVRGWAYTRHREKPVRYDEGKGKRPRTSGQSGRPVLKDLKKNMNTIKERKR